MLKQKTFWAGIVLVVTGVGQIVAEGDVMKGGTTIMTGIGIIWAGREGPAAAQ